MFLETKTLTLPLAKIGHKMLQNLKVKSWVPLGSAPPDFLAGVISKPGLLRAVNPFCHIMLFLKNFAVIFKRGVCAVIFRRGFLNFRGISRAKPLRWSTVFPTLRAASDYKLVTIQLLLYVEQWPLLTTTKTITTNYFKPSISI